MRVGGEALREARHLADGDALLAGALARAGRDGKVTQDLAGAPALLQRYEQASPQARAVLEAPARSCVTLPSRPARLLLTRATAPES